MSISIKVQGHCDICKEKGEYKHNMEILSTPEGHYYGIAHFGNCFDRLKEKFNITENKVKVTELGY